MYFAPFLVWKIEKSQNFQFRWNPTWCSLVGGGGRKVVATSTTSNFALKIKKKNYLIFKKLMTRVKLVLLSILVGSFGIYYSYISF